jgi:hypothetical protein
MMNMVPEYPVRAGSVTGGQAARAVVEEIVRLRTRRVAPQPWTAVKEYPRRL